LIVQSPGFFATYRGEITVTKNQNLRVMLPVSVYPGAGGREAT
jgi:hypothetical protein